MKFKYRFWIPLALTAALLFSGCGARQQASADTAGDSSSAAPVQTASLSAASAGTEETAASELFSKRDLSGEYDASAAVSVVLTGAGAEADFDGVQIDGSTVTITAAGTYILTGTLEDGSIIVDAGKEDKVQLVLSGVKVHSETFAAIYVRQADKVFVTLASDSVNALSNGGTFTLIDDSSVDAVIFSKDDLTLNGSGTLEISSPGGHGIVGKDEVTITGGTYRIAAANHAISGKDSIAIAGGSFALAAYKDGLHAENDDDDTLGNITITGGDFVIQVEDDAIHATYQLQIDGGSFDITAAEGLEATCIRINDGNISIQASDDGINAARKSSASVPTIEINGGTTTIVMGPGDTDGVDSNGNIVISGGTVSVTGNSAFDYDGTAKLNGGTVIINGTVVDSIPNSMMGGGMPGGMGGPGGGMPGGQGGGPGGKGGFRG